MMMNCVAITAHQLDPVALLVSLLWFIVGSLHLHGLEWLWQVVALCEVFGPLGNVCLQQRRVLIMLQYTLRRVSGWVGGGGKNRGRSGGRSSHGPRVLVE